MIPNLAFFPRGQTQMTQKAKQITVINLPHTTIKKAARDQANLDLGLP